MSTLFVDTINEKTTGNGIQIPGHVVKVTRVQNTAIDTTVSSSSYVSLFTFDLTATAGNIIYISSVVPHRGGGTGYQLAVLRLLAGSTVVWGSGWSGDNNDAAQNEPLSEIGVSASWVWTGSGSNTQTINVQAKTYNGNQKYYGANNQVSDATTTPVFTVMEIAQ